MAIEYSNIYHFYLPASYDTIRTYVLYGLYCVQSCNKEVIFRMGRTILHADCNNFYASVECLYNPALRGKPVAVAGDPEQRHGIVLAKIIWLRLAESKPVIRFG